MILFSWEGARRFFGTVTFAAAEHQSSSTEDCSVVVLVKLVKLVVLVELARLVVLGLLGVVGVISACSSSGSPNVWNLTRFFSLDVCVAWRRET